MTRDSASVLVTGAGGFIGAAVARRLAAQHDRQVYGGTRDSRAIGAGITPCRLDVRDPASMTAALVGIDAVVHCAYGDRATTVDGTRLLLQAARAAKVRRVVHFSSIAVYGSANGVVAEKTPLIAAAGSGYAHWKVATEHACLAAAGVEVVILRPAIVYGPGSTRWVELPVQRLLTKQWGDLGDMGCGTANLVHIDDVAGACVAALEASGVAGETFNIAGSETISWREWYCRIAAALNVGPLQKVSPAAWRRRAMIGLPFRVLARSVPALEPLIGARTLLAPSPHELRLFALAAVYPAAKAADRLGWRALIKLDDGMQDCIGLARATGLAA